MDLLQELENMVTNIEDEHDDPNDKPAGDEIAKWQHLFSYSYNEAIEHITNQRHDFSRCRVSDELWALLQSEKEAQGYSREAFEHEIRSRSNNQAIPPEPQPQPRPLANNNSASRAEPTYLILLTGPLTNAQQIASIASLPSPPSTRSATSEDAGSSSSPHHLFCHIDASTKATLHHWLTIHHPSFTPTVIRVSPAARKDLASTSLYPTLGIDSTLPPTPHRHAVAVASTARVPRHLLLLRHARPPGVPAPITRTARRGGRGRSNAGAHSRRGAENVGGGKYKALVDGGEGDVVQGLAYVVECEEREEVLRGYETAVYEVVRCGIVLDGGGGGEGW